MVTANGNYGNLFVADIRAGVPEIADESIDWIVTDPPYPPEYLDCWQSLGELAKRVLKPTGGLLALAAHYHFPKYLHALEQSLDFYWLPGIIYGSSTGKAYNHPRNVLCAWKPFLWFVKDVKFCEHVNTCDFFYLNHPAKRSLHKWQQAVEVFVEVIKHIIPPGKKIYDPFLGSGTTDMACSIAGYDFLGSDIDPNCIEITTKRMNEHEHPLKNWMKSK